MSREPSLVFDLREGDIYLELGFGGLLLYSRLLRNRGLGSLIYFAESRERRPRIIRLRLLNVKEAGGRQEREIRETEGSLPNCILRKLFCRERQGCLLHCLHLDDHHRRYIPRWSNCLHYN